MMKKFLSLLFLILIIKNILAYTWQNVVIMGGGFVSGLAYSPVQPNLIYARTDVGGLYRWDNSVKKWIPLTDMSSGSFMGGESIAPDPVNPNIVYAAVGFSGYGYILKSTDMGNSWTAYPVPISIAANNDGRQAGERLAIDPNLPSKLYFGSRWQGLWVSTDSGANWTKVTSFPTNGDAGYGISWVIFPKPAGGYGNPSGSASQIIYVGVMALSSGNSNVYRSTNGGTSWSVISGGPSGMITQHASLGSDGFLWIVYNNNYGPNGISSGQVWKLNTSNLSWTNVTPSNGPPNGSGGYGDVCVDAQNPQHAILSTLDWWSGPDRIFQTTNGGTNWTVISLHNAGWNPGPYSVFDLNGAYWGYGCGGNPGGAGWAGNAKIDPFNSNNAIYTSGSGPGGGGVWSSTNINASNPPQGITWVFTDSGLEETVAIYMTASIKGSVLFSCLGDICGMRHTNLSQSPTSGIYCNPQFSNTNCLDYAENNPNIVVRVGNSGSITTDIAYSTNNGQSWLPWGSAPPGYASSNQMGSVAVAADGSAVVVSPYSGFGSPAYATSLGGGWTTCSGLPSGAFVASDRVNASTFYATYPSKWVYGGNVNIYRSTDYGKTFTQVNSIPVQWSDPNGNGEFVIPRPIFSIAGEFWVSTYDSLYRFTNGGTTVAKILNVYEPMGPVGFGKAASGQTHPVVYLIGTVNGTYGFYRCDDGVGNTWVRINDSNQQFGGPKWIAGDQDIYGRCYIGGSGRGILYCDSAETPTNTITFTPINTSTNTQTATFTSTSTITNTRTYTITNTVTNTRTNTFTNTATFTPTNTMTSTLTNTRTNTNTQTLTFTSTNTKTNTITTTFTLTNSMTYTPTSTHTNSVALTLTESFTFTPTFTNTMTPTYTGTILINTSTNTQIPTLTNTATASNTIEMTATPSNTSTTTMTQTPSNTRTHTSTVILTFTCTQTATSSQQPTFTSTPTNTVLQVIQTYTPEIPIEGELKIEKYQNPYNPEKDDLKIKILVKCKCKLIKVKIYTTSFRLIKQIIYENNYTGEVTLTMDKRNLNTLTNGIYYLLITGMNKEGKTINSKPIILIILK